MNLSRKPHVAPLVFVIAIAIAASLALCRVPAAAARAVRAEDLVRLAAMVQTVIGAGDLAALGRLLDEEGLEPDTRFAPNEESPNTPLALAIAALQLPAAGLLLERGASPDLRTTMPAVDERGRRDPEAECYTPLMFAAAAGFTEGVRLLIERGAEVDAAGYEGCTALAIAAGFDSAAVARALLAAGANPETALESTRCLSVFPMSTADNDRRKVVRGLPRSGKATALWVAAAAGSEETALVLVGAGADRGAAADCTDARMTGAPGRGECTPLRAATLLGQEGTARLLADEGGEAAAVVSRAAFPRMDPKELEQRLAGVVERQDAAALRDYLDAGLRVNEVLPGRVTPLVMAGSAAAPALLKLLLEHGADPSLPVRSLMSSTYDYRGERCAHETTPLLAAIKAGCGECVRLLLAAGAGREQRRVECDEGAAGGVKSHPPLVWAVLCSRPAIVHLLLEAGANPDAPVSNTTPSNGAPECHGATPLWIAAFNGEREIAELLLAGGASPEAAVDCTSVSKVEKKCTPQRIAELRGNGELAELIGKGGPAARVKQTPTP